MARYDDYENIAHTTAGRPPRCPDRRSERGRAASEPASGSIPRLPEIIEAYLCPRRRGECVWVPLWVWPGVLLAHRTLSPCRSLPRRLHRQYSYPVGNGARPGPSSVPYPP